jgi:multicomponent Na+:H+ antiporter subunit F
MTGAIALDYATLIALLLLIAAMAVTVVRIILGPTLADRILGLDLITTLAIGIIAVIAMRTGFGLYVDIAISLGLVGFLSTVALARYLLSHAETRRAGESVE